jgi:hypothetical protein
MPVQASGHAHFDCKIILGRLKNKTEQETIVLTFASKFQVRPSSEEKQPDSFAWHNADWQKQAEGGVSGPDHWNQDAFQLGSLLKNLATWGLSNECDGVGSLGLHLEVKDAALALEMPVMYENLFLEKQLTQFVMMQHRGHYDQHLEKRLIQQQHEARRC